jgi:putative effector of murein hydrolase LrgA (UPF0299 family)
MIEFFPTARISRVAGLITVVFAMLMLFIPVIVFFLVSMSRAWIAIIVLILCLSFSTIVSLLTNGGIQDKVIFVGTATYCAVLVTFLNNVLPRSER